MESGTLELCNDKFTKIVTVGISSSTESFTIQVGAGSREQLLVGDFAMILRTLLSVTAEKTFSEHVNARVGIFN